jgi:hypothetical protein
MGVRTMESGRVFQDNLLMRILDPPLGVLVSQATPSQAAPDDVACETMGAAWQKIPFIHQLCVDPENGYHFTID